MVMLVFGFPTTFAEVGINLRQAIESVNIQDISVSVHIQEVYYLAVKYS